MVEVAGFQAPVPSSLKTGWSYYSMNNNIENTKSRALFEQYGIIHILTLHAAIVDLSWYRIMIKE